MDSPRTAGATLAALILAIGAPLVFGQPTAPEPAPAPRPGGLVTLEAFVTDASGVPVKGLGAGDFDLAQDGVPVPITDLSGPTAARHRRSPSADPRGVEVLVVVVVAAPATAVPQPGPALAEAGTSGTRAPWGAGVRVMVAAGGDPVTVRQPFTTDPQPVLQALAAIASGAPGAPTPDPGRARTSLAGLTSFVDSLGGLPGRKALLFIADSPPAGVPDATSAETQDPVRALAARANAAGVGFYCAGPERGGAVAERLRPLVSATGGLAVETSAGVAGAVATVAGDLEGAYSLRFAPPSGGDGALHQVSVRVRRDGAVVRTRSAFRDLDDDDRMTGRTLAALLFGVADNPLAIQVSATTEPNPREGTQLVTVLVSIPLGSLAFAPRTVSHDCDLALWLAARDGEGHVTRAPKAKFPISVPNDRLLTALTQTAGYAFKVPLRSGGATFAVTVRDEIASRAATELTALTPIAGPPTEVTP